MRLVALRNEIFPQLFNPSIIYVSKNCMLLKIMPFEVIYFYDESVKFLESSLRLTLKMASDVGDPDALGGFIGPGELRTSRIYTVLLLRTVNTWRCRRSTLTFSRDRPVVTTMCKKLCRMVGCLPLAYCLYHVS
jgi:hypothetical protein